jgi:hypothetical protein
MMVCIFAEELKESQEANAIEETVEADKGHKKTVYFHYMCLAKKATCKNFAFLFLSFYSILFFSAAALTLCPSGFVVYNATPDDADEILDLSGGQTLRPSVRPFKSSAQPTYMRDWLLSKMNERDTYVLVCKKSGKIVSAIVMSKKKYPSFPALVYSSFPSDSFQRP